MSETQDRRFMRRAVELARRGMGRASPNPPVGCVIVRNGRIVGEGSHVYERRDHAEVCALAAAGERARGATAYVTLEPCAHHGRTGPCADALVRAGVARVVVPIDDPNPRVRGRGLERLRRAGIAVEVGVSAGEARRVIEPFACHVSTGRPLVVGKAAMSIDGRIATVSGQSRWISSPEARRFGQRLRLELDGLLVGVGTILTDDPELTYRGARTRGRPLVRAVLDGRLRTPPTARVFESAADAPIILFCLPGAVRSRRRALEARGAEVVAIAGRGGRLDPRRVLAELGRRRLLGVLVEGGSAIHWSFMEARLYDKFYFVVAPLVLGGVGALPPVGGDGFRTIEEAPRFRIARRFSAGPDTILEAYPSYSRSIASPWRREGDSPSGVPGPGAPSQRR